MIGVYAVAAIIDLNQHGGRHVMFAINANSQSEAKGMSHEYLETKYNYPTINSLMVLQILWPSESHDESSSASDHVQQ